MKDARKRGECFVYSSVTRKEVDATIHVTPPITRRHISGVLRHTARLRRGAKTGKSSMISSKVFPSILGGLILMNCLSTMFLSS